MESNDLDEIDQLAIAIETEIAETQAFLDSLPDFAPRSQRSQKMERAVKNT